MRLFKHISKLKIYRTLLTVKIMILSRYRYHPVTVPLPFFCPSPFLFVPQGRWGTMRDDWGGEGRMGRLGTGVSR
jgi:hypothetical protein